MLLRASAVVQTFRLCTALYAPRVVCALLPRGAALLATARGVSTTALWYCDR